MKIIVTVSSAQFLFFFCFFFVMVLSLPTFQELQRRCNTLISLIEKEMGEVEVVKRKHGQKSATNVSSTVSSDSKCTSAGKVSVLRNMKGSPFPFFSF